MNFFHLQLIHHTDPSVPEHLRHSFALALAEKVSAQEFDGVTKGEQPLDDGGQLLVPATFIFATPEAEAWRAEWLATMSALTFPDVATLEAVQAIPYVTPSLLMHLIRQEQAPKKPVRPPRPARPASKAKDGTPTPAAAGQKDGTPTPATDAGPNADRAPDAPHHRPADSAAPQDGGAPATPHDGTGTERQQLSA